MPIYVWTQNPPEKADRHLGLHQMPQPCYISYTSLKTLAPIHKFDQI